MVKCPRCNIDPETREHYEGGFITGCWSDLHLETVDEFSEDCELYPMTGHPCDTKEQSVESWNMWVDLFRNLDKEQGLDWIASIGATL